VEREAMEYWDSTDMRKEASQGEDLLAPAVDQIQTTKVSPSQHPTQKTVIILVN
jgi:hypothetical protein